MYDLQFTATDDSDWAQAVELIDNDTGLPLTDAATALFELGITDDCDTTVLSASTANTTITRPSSGVIQWIFTKAQLGGLCVGTTYKIGCRMTGPSGSILVFTGTLAFIDGGM
jgi:hypothetical protein